MPTYSMQVSWQAKDGTSWVEGAAYSSGERATADYVAACLHPNVRRAVLSCRASPFSPPRQVSIFVRSAKEMRT